MSVLVLSQGAISAVPVAIEQLDVTRTAIEAPVEVKRTFALLLSMTVLPMMLALSVVSYAVGAAII